MSAVYLLQQFSSYSNHNCKKSSFLRTPGFIFCLPWDAPVAIMQNVAWMKRQFRAYQTPRSMYLSIFNSFRVIRCLPLKSMHKSKNRYFYHIFVCPGDAPVASMQNVAWMKRQFSACQTRRSMYTSILNSFPVIRTASAKNRHFNVLQATFLFPLETPLRLSRNMLHASKDNSMLAKPLAACIHLSSIVSELYDA